MAKVISWTESLDHLGTRGCFGGNNEVGLPEEDFIESGAVVKAVVQEKQISLFKVGDKLFNENMFGG